jgi:DNA recombination protein RmuC
MFSFVEHLGSLGKSINKSAEESNKTVGSLEHRLLPSARRLEQSGLSDNELELPGPIEVRAIAPTQSDR